jgi:hypothetical protein
MIQTNQLTQALPLLMQQWAPINGPLLSSLRIRLRRGEFESDSETILNDLHSDPALYCYCLLNVEDTFAQNENNKKTLPQQLLHNLRMICNGFTLFESPHRISQANQAQLRSYRKMLTKTSASIVLAPYFNINGELAYAASALRELGLSLIAWNYPRIYQQAISENSDTTLSDELRAKLVDQQLNRMLGFTPFTLSLAITKNAPLAPELLASFDHEINRDTASSESQLVGSTLKKICEISEMFAQATLPDASESALHKWDIYREELMPVIGATGLIMLRDSCNNVLQRYAEQLPELAAKPIPARTCTPPTRSSSQRYLHNLHIPHCSYEVQEALRYLYSKIDNQTIAFDNIKNLLQTIAPKANFHAGAIYLLNPDTLELEPRLTLGKTNIPFVKVKYRADSEKSNPVSLAFLARTPMIESHNDSGTLSLAGILGNAQRVGVLYLEPNIRAESNANNNPRLHFKAIQQALSDCLNLY